MRCGGRDDRGEVDEMRRGGGEGAWDGEWGTGREARPTVRPVSR